MRPTATSATAPQGHRTAPITSDHRPLFQDLRDARPDLLNSLRLSPMPLPLCSTILIVDPDHAAVPPVEPINRELP